MRVDVRLGSALAGLALCGSASVLLATDGLGAGPVSFAASVSAIAVTILLTAWCIHRRTDGSARAVALSPFTVAAATWTVLFVLRPLELYFFPDHASLALGELGFDSAALTRAVAVAARWPACQRSLQSGGVELHAGRRPMTAHPYSGHRNEGRAA